jgi:hypothetical protein
MRRSTLSVIILGFLASFTLNAQSSHGQQTTNGPCSPIYNGNGNTTICNSPPGYRVIYMADAKKAIALLQAQPPTSKVRFTIIGGSAEINAFADNVGALFAEAHWTMLGVSRIGEMSGLEADGTISHGEGVVCRGINGNAAYEAAKLALAAAGHPCKARPFPSSPGALDGVDIFIGTRILPQD